MKGAVRSPLSSTHLPVITHVLEHVASTQLLYAPASRVAAEFYFSWLGFSIFLFLFSSSSFLLSNPSSALIPLYSSSPHLYFPPIFILLPPSSSLFPLPLNPLSSTFPHLFFFPPLFILLPPPYSLFPGFLCLLPLPIFLSPLLFILLPTSYSFFHLDSAYPFQFLT